MSAPYPYRLTATRPPQIGLVALQSDETIELDFRRLFPLEAELMVTRVPSAEDVTPESLAAMEAHLAGAASLFPRSANFAVVGYGCTSGTAQIGAGAIEALISGATRTACVTQPVSALLAACQSLGLRRLALLSPYVADVSDRLRSVLAEGGIETPVFGSFEVAEEARVARIDGPSLSAAATALIQQARTAGGVDGLFMSCTNLRTLDIIGPLEDHLGLPVLSSNQVLAWHLMQLAGISAAPGAPGQLFAGPLRQAV